MTEQGAASKRMASGTAGKKEPRDSRISAKIRRKIYLPPESCSWGKSGENSLSRAKFRACPGWRI